MATERDYQGFYDRIAGLRETLAQKMAPGLAAGTPGLAESIIQQIDSLLSTWESTEAAAAPPPDKGLAQMAGIGPDAATDFSQTRVPVGVTAYDETVISERIVAVGDLYYIYQHERIGVFRAVQKLQELFRAGTVRLSAGAGAFALYQFDRREVLRYTQKDRYSAYRRILGYGDAPVPSGSRSNSEFHNLFTHFVNQVTLFWRDKRISDVIKGAAQDPSYGSIAMVRRAGLDLRNNLKWTSYGHLNVMRVEVMQLLDEAFRILNSDDVKRLFGADNAWDAVEEILVRYFGEKLATSPRQRMAITARNMLRWLSSTHILQTTRSQFETLLADIAEDGEEWLTSAQSLGHANRSERNNVMPAERLQMRIPLGCPTPAR